MAGVLPHYKLGPASYVAGKPITGGTLVCATTTGDGTSNAAGASVRPIAALADGASVLGVAATDAGITQWPEGTPATSSGTADGNPLLDQSTLNFTVAVYNNIDINVKYSVAATFGEVLFNDASGGVTPTQGTGAVAVGRCTQPGGVAAGAVGRAFIRV